jgi:hypothetical protein
MKNAILLKIASLFIFLLSAQFSFGQTILTNDDFNQGVGTWTSGGQDAIWYDLDDIGEHSNWFTYNNCTNLIDHVFLLRDNSNAASSIISQTYDLSGYDSVAFEYDYGVYSMDSNGEDWFLEFSDNNGATWQTVKQYIRTKDFYNNHCGVWGSNSKEVVTLQSSDYTFNSTNKFRLRIDASGDADFLFVDNVVVMGNTDSYGFDIFYEDFSDDTSSGNASDFSGTDEINNIPWTADEQGSANRWKIEGGKWKGKQVYTPSSLTTDAFSISGYQALQFEFFIDYKELENTQNEWVRVFYTIDDGTEQTLVEYRGEESDQTYTVNLPSTAVGNNIVLRIEMHHDSNKDEHKIDNIRLKGFDPNYIGPVNLFFEDQADASQSGSTISGSGTSATNPSGITWTMNDPGGDVQVHNGDHIHCSKLDGDTVTWETGDIIISGYTNLNFTVFAQKIDNFGSSDYIKLQYSIDGGTTRVNIATYNTNLTDTNIGGDINTLTSTTVAGDTLKIYIEVFIDDDEEEFKWEDITLTGIPFYNVWQGTNVDLVTDTAKWSKGSQPTAASNVWIPNTKHLKLTDDQAYNTVNARATSQLTIEKTGSLTTVGDFTKIAGTGTVTLNSDATEFASIVVGGTAAGDITYNKYVNYQAYEEWDLVGPPVLNQNMKTFAQTNTNNNSTSGAMSMGGDYYALGQYYTGWGSWVNYTTSTIPDANFPVAKGYQMATNAVENNSSLEGQSLTFTGEIATTTQTINIQNQNGANGGYGRRWNLVANPFPSYLNGNTNAGAQNFIDTNEGVIDSSYLAIYAWKADGTGWHTFNQLDTNNDDGTLFIAPGQAFFVAAASTDVAQIQFTPSMRTITGGDDFISGATPMLLNYKLDLKLYNGSAERAKTKLHFQQGLILGLDPGYDAGAYDQATALSSRLPEDDQGVNFQLNAMNLEAAYNQTIPLVVNQQEGQSFRISISNNTLPEDINVYLEDVFNGTLTSLKDQDFELSAESDLSDAGRFYIRFTTQNLAINDVLSPSSLTIFKLNTDAFVTIQGLSPEMGKTTATLYNMLGMKVRSKTLNNTAATQQISTQGLASGVYIIKLKAGEQAVSKKVIIQ